MDDALKFLKEVIEADIFDFVFCDENYIPELNMYVAAKYRFSKEFIDEVRNNPDYIKKVTRT